MLPSYIRVCAVVWAYGHRQTDTHADTQTCVTTIHFASSTTHAKCNKSVWIAEAFVHIVGLLSYLKQKLN